MRWMIILCGLFALPAMALSPQGCDRLSTGPRVILEPIHLGATAPGIDVSSSFKARLAELWAAAEREPHPPGLRLELQFDDCWTWRINRGVQLRLPDPTDFDRSRVFDFEQWDVLAVMWGIAGDEDLRVQVLVTPLLVPMLHAGRAPGDGLKAVKVKAKDATPTQKVDALIASQALVLIGMMSRIELALETLARGRGAPPVAGVCLRNAITSRLTWVAKRAAVLATDTENEWLLEWVERLRTKNLATPKGAACYE